MDIETKIFLMNQSYKWHYKEWQRTKQSRWLLLAKATLHHMNKLMKQLNKGVTHEEETIRPDNGLAS